MKKSISFFKQTMLAILGTSLFSLNVQGYDILPTTINATQPAYIDPQGALVQSGTIVTVNNAATVLTFTNGLTIEANATLTINGATIRVANGKKIILTQNPSTLITDLGAKLTLTNNAIITSSVATPASTAQFWAGIECKGVPTIAQGSAFLEA